MAGLKWKIYGLFLRILIFSSPDFIFKEVYRWPLLILLSPLLKLHGLIFVIFIANDRRDVKLFKNFILELCSYNGI